MIKYRLECKACKITFDSWFASSREYEKLKKKKFLICHNCNSQKVEKTLMAPHLVNSKKKSKDTMDPKKYNSIKKVIKNYKKNFKFVGENFAYEARLIHYNKKKKIKGIYGSASKQDLKELKEEGIESQMMPWIEAEDN